ncbi:MAG: DNA polymerase III subunit gamma/tau [Proteobacteria bacterium]|nr:DNA polymerase III subunit gamma/tau [Pseudomonadota bacterium]
MSYLVLARKYRPRSFEAMVGQEHVVQALANALTQQRLHHAYLFTGTRGVGKTTVSRILAKSLNCTGPDGQGGITAQPCGVCDACRDIDAGRFVDYVELDAASNRGVEEISQLLDQAVYKPVLGRFKVYMIDEVHMLSNTAFNAMLKTLEEPPEYLKFVLATTDPQKVPPTVLSRCLQFNLRPMAPQTVQEHLAAVLAQEQIAAEPGALRLLARAARGSMRDALSLTDQAIAFGAGALAEAGVRQMLGAVDRGHAVRLVEALAAGDGAALVQSVDGLRALGLSAAGTLEEMAALLQQMAVQQAVPGALDAGDPDTAVVERLAAALAPDETQLLYSIVVHGRGELALAPDEYSGLVMVLLRMLAFKPAGSGSAERAAPRPATAPAQALSAAAARPAAVAAAPALRVPTPPPVRAPAPRAAPAPAPVARSPEPPPWVDAPDESELAEPVGLPAPEVPEPRPRAAVAAVVTTPLGDRWTALVKRLVEAGAISALVRELAMQSECTAFDEARIVLRVDRETLRSTANVDKLGTAIAQALGRAVALQVEAGTPEDSPARRDAAERARRQAEAEQIIADDPLVKALMAQYRTARIVPGSIKPH